MFVSVLLVLLCVLFIFLQLRSGRPKNFPPGPPILPVVGNLLELNLENPLKDFERLRTTYGDVYSLFIGRKAAVVINGLETVKEAIMTKAADFAGRPQDLLVNDVTQRKGVILADYGSSWREHRRFALMTLRNFGLGKKSMENRILDEIQYTIKTLEKSIGSTLCPRVMFHNAASNIICQVLFGARYEYDDQRIKVIVQCFTENAKIANGPWAMVYDSIPGVRHLPLPFGKAFENYKTCQDFAFRLVNEHKKTRVPNEPRDFLDCYLDELEKRGDDGSSFSEEQLTNYILDLHFAGTDTTSNTLLTAFLYLMNYPHVQGPPPQDNQRFMGHSHLYRVGPGRVRKPVFTTEKHECGPFIPLFLLFRLQGTMIIQNMASVLREEGQWKFPHEFNPENFLNEEGEFVKPEAFMPFSAGPRVCLGESLARMELFLILVTLLRKYKFIWPEDAGEPDYTPVYGVTLTPKAYRMKVQPRTSN
uniref:Cytochrome P450 2F2-like n=1 Tax=Nothobranchius furzeri TaxID=105023 RepID=A0A8C6M1R3_NOTFU